MVFKTDRQRRAAFANMFSKGASDKPDYSEDTWQKHVAGVPKYEIDEYYRGIWPKLEPQLRGRNVLVRYAYDGEQVVKRHPHGKESFTTIDSADVLSEIVREHGVELWPETSKKGDLGRADMVVIDIDDLGGASKHEMNDVVRGVHKKLGASFGKPYVINTANGYHVGVRLGGSIPYKTLRNRVDKEVIEPLEKEYPGVVSKKYDKAPIWLDKTPIKKHGSTKAEGSLNLPDLVISQKISIGNIDDFERRRLR